jgi:hypothetical protein
MCREVIPLGTEFYPGHALRYAAELRRRSMLGDEYARRELYSRGWTPLSRGKSGYTYAFGFEAEFFGMSHEHAAEALSGNGIDTRADGYHHNTKDYWRITEDGSVSYEGCELVSPILGVRNKDDIATSRKSLSILRAEGGQVNRSCGLHIHHNLRGKTCADVSETLAHWAGFQPLIDTIVPPSRRNGEYVSSMYDAVRWRNAALRNMSMPEHIPATRMDTTYFGRYHAVNLQAVHDHGTIEYRQHSGTLNPEKLYNWVLFTRAMHDVARVGKWSVLQDIYGANDDTICRELGLEGMLSYLGLPKKVREFYKERQKALSEHGIDDEDIGADGDCEPDGEFDDEGGQWCGSCGEYHYED